MSKFKDLAGKKFGRLVALGIHGLKNGRYLWLCKCDCGKEKIARGTHLTYGSTKSCGCLVTETSKKLISKLKKYCYKDITGQKFGKLLVVSKIDKRSKYGLVMWNCKCDCGNIKLVSGVDLRKGSVKSCGCLIPEYVSHPLYKKFKGMKNRCYNPNKDTYQYYGGKGIVICDEWLENVVKFIEWGENNGWKDEMTIDRIDPNKNYCPENCQFITASENIKKRWKDNKC